MGRIGVLICCGAIVGCCAAALATAGSQHGTARADRLVGTKGADRIKGRAGNDRIHGGAGRDVLIGGPGDDRLYGDGGRDEFNMRGGVELASGGEDRIFARDGHPDSISCGSGDDVAIVDVVEDGVYDCERVIEP